MSNQQILNFKSQSQKALEFLKGELTGMRSGRATPALVEDLMVEVYENRMDLKSLAAINTPEVRLIIIQPWDPSIIPNIEKAILSSNLGLTPNTDQNIIRLSIPPLTSERREILVKLVKEKLEETKIKIRGFRREAMEELKGMKDSGTISEDEERRWEKELQKEVDELNQEVEKIGEGKQSELREI